jgi:large subunit ribosomal protein L15
MQLHELTTKNPKQKDKRVGRGGGRGKTSGRGTKGQKARAGHKHHAGYPRAAQKAP